MNQAVGTNPELYDAAGTPPSRKHPALKGGRCACGHVYFPWQTYGCEVCGRYGEDLTPLLIVGRGTLRASVKVHLHAAKDRDVPFTIGAIALDDGPTLRAVLDVDHTQSLVPGTRMVATLVTVGNGESGEPVIELRFKPEEGAG